MTHNFVVTQTSVCKDNITWIWTDTGENRGSNLATPYRNVVFGKGPVLPTPRPDFCTAPVPTCTGSGKWDRPIRIPLFGCPIFGMLSDYIQPSEIKISFSIIIVKVFKMLVWDTQELGNDLSHPVLVNRILLQHCIRLTPTRWKGRRWSRPGAHSTIVNRWATWQPLWSTPVTCHTTYLLSASQTSGSDCNKNPAKNGDSHFWFCDSRPESE